MLNKRPNGKQPAARKLIATWLPPAEAEAFAAVATPRGGIAKVLRDFARRYTRAHNRAA